MNHLIDVFAGNEIRKRRVSAGLSQSDLARDCGISFQQLQKYEYAQNRVSSSRLAQIAGALACSVEVFFPEEYRGYGYSADEEVLIQRYRKMPTETQAAFMHMARGANNAA